MAKKDKSTITVNDVEYDVNDFTDEQKALLNHVQDLDRKLGNAQFNLDQLMVGREAFVARLAASLEAKSEDIAAE
jgi:cell division protein ZapA (FtsZ GTPase activity inhibitor)